MRTGKNRKPREAAFVVRMTLPEGATVRAARDYVEDAVATWKGSLTPPWAEDHGAYPDPMFGLDGDSVRVTRLRRRK